MPHDSTYPSGRPLRAFVNWACTTGYSRSEIRFVGNLLRRGGDLHSRSHRGMAGLLYLDPATYLRTRDTMLQIRWVEHCDNLLCNHREWGPIGLRLTMEFYLYLEPYEVFHREPEVFHRETPSVSRSNQSRGRDKRSKEVPSTDGPAPAAPGILRKDETMPRNQEEPWDGPVLGELEKPPPRPKGSVSGRIRSAFTQQVRSASASVVVCSSVAKMNTNIRWLLDNNYTEKVIIDSFTPFVTHMRRDMAPSVTAWDEYFSKRKGFLEQAARGQMSLRPGQEMPTMERLIEERLADQAQARRDGKTL